MPRINIKILYWRWVIANGFGEFFGLGLTFVLTALVFTRLGDSGGVRIVLGTFSLAVASGAVEAAIVGLAQWWAMHPWFPGITRRAWWLATLIGALVAYVLGYLPSTVMSLGEQSSPPAAEPPQWVVLMLAAGLGAVGGAVLSFVQWRVLRRTVPHAGWWIPANMLAWTAGMPIIFRGIDAAQKGQPLWQAVLIISGYLLAAGAVVGAIHGAFLVRLSMRK